MTREEIIAALNTEIHRLTSARDLLASQTTESAASGRRGRRPAGSALNLNPEEGAPKRRGGMSAEGRARVAEAQRRRWAKRKREGAATAKAAGATRKATPARSANASKAAKAPAKKSAAAKKAPARVTKKAVVKAAPAKETAATATE